MLAILGQGDPVCLSKVLTLHKVLLPRVQPVRANWKPARAVRAPRARESVRTLRANQEWFEEDGSEPCRHSQPTNSRQGSYERVDRQRLWKNKRLKYMNYMLSLAKKGEVEEVERIFGRMLEARVYPDAPLYNTLILGYARVGDAKMAFKRFNDMKKRSIDPTSHTYSTLFSACSRAGPCAATILTKIQDEIERKKLELNIISHNALVSALAHCGMSDEAFEAYSRILQLAIQPTLETFSALLVAAARDKERGLDRALRTWSEMRLSGLEPDLFSYNCLLQCLRDGGIVNGMPEACYHQTVAPPMVSDLVKMFPSMGKDAKSLSRNADSEEGTVAAGHFGSSSDINRAVSEMESLRTLADERTVETAGQRKTTEGWHCSAENESACGTETVRSLTDEPAPNKPVEGKVVEAYHQVSLSLGDGLTMALFIRRGQLRWIESTDITSLMQLFRQKRWRLDIRTFHLLASLSVDLQLLLRHMRRRKIVPDESFLMSALWQRKKMGDRLGAMGILKLMERLCVRKSQQGYQLVATLCYTEQEGMELLEAMDEADIIPGVEVYSLLLRSALRMRRYDYVIKLLKRMKCEDVRPSEVTWDMLQLAVENQPKGDWQEMKHNGFKEYLARWRTRMLPSSQLH